MADDDSLLRMASAGPITHLSIPDIPLHTLARVAILPNLRLKHLTFNDDPEFSTAYIPAIITLCYRHAATLKTILLESDNNPFAALLNETLQAAKLSIRVFTTP